LSPQEKMTEALLWNTAMQNKILETLLSKYENSKHFNNQSKVNRRVSIDPAKEFPQYKDDSQVDFCKKLNSVLRELATRNLVVVKWATPSLAESVSLNIDAINEAYSLTKKVSRKDEQLWLKEQLGRYSNDKSQCVVDYVNAQIQRIEANKNVEFYTGDKQEFLDVLTSVSFICCNEEELLIRNASLHLFKDSKRLEAISSTVESFMKKYGDFEGCDDVFAECNVVKTPTLVVVKGNAIIHFEHQDINLVLVHGDLGFSTQTLQKILSVEVLGNRIVTVENLTSFYTYTNMDDVVIYLGGFHNSIKREFIKLIAKGNPEKQFLHFGDIDAGGFFILEHLRKKTGINFSPLFMDIVTLKKYAKSTKALTKNDVERLKKFLQHEEFGSVVSYMLENNCKLEQENVLTGI